MKDPALRIDEEVKAGSARSIVNLVDALIEHAYSLRASDIHLDPQAESLKLRFRVDGVLKTMHSLPLSCHEEITGRIKILAQLRTDEHQAAQDGRFRCDLSEHGQIDIRVSVVPAYYGENIVLRLLTDNFEPFTLELLGFGPKQRERIEAAIARPHGMILVTGPTGSGKTTTLYTFLKLLNSDDISIITIEDPIEYAIPGLTQIQTNPKRGLSFASGLRSILRQDPDLIMVGEVRDQDTAGIAVNTALTGHLLFSTLHTRDAVTTLPRLHDLGVEAYLLAATVNLIIAQRLLRRNCPKCASQQPLSEAERRSLMEVFPKTATADLREQTTGRGCIECDNSGYSGRISINEVLQINEPLREAILNRSSSTTLRKLAVEGGMLPMLEDGLEKIKEGMTTIEELLRVIHE